MAKKKRNTAKWCKMQIKIVACKHFGHIDAPKGPSYGCDLNMRRCRLVKHDDCESYELRDEVS